MPDDPPPKLDYATLQPKTREHNYYWVDLLVYVGLSAIVLAMVIAFWISDGPPDPKALLLFGSILATAAISLVIAFIRSHR